MNKSSEKVNEQRARRFFCRLGMALSKSRSEYGFSSLHHSGPRYMVTESNIVRDYGNDLDEMMARWPS